MSPYLPWVAITTVLSLIFYLFTGIQVARMRGKHKVDAPVMTGPAEFERAVRVQMNTLEWLPVYLVGLWLFAVYVEPRGGAVIGLVWILGRALYMRGYLEAPAKRSLGFLVQALATFALLGGALIGAAVKLGGG